MYNEYNCTHFFFKTRRIVCEMCTAHFPLWSITTPASTSILACATSRGQLRLVLMFVFYSCRCRKSDSTHVCEYAKGSSTFEARAASVGRVRWSDSHQNRMESLRLNLSLYRTETQTIRVPPKVDSWDPPVDGYLDGLRNARAVCTTTAPPKQWREKGK